METSIRKSKENPFIVRKVSMVDTFRNLPIGRPIEFDCREVGLLNTAYAAANRLRASKEGEYKIEPKENGAHYVVTRLA